MATPPRHTPPPALRYQASLPRHLRSVVALMLAWDRNRSASMLPLGPWRAGNPDTFALYGYNGTIFQSLAALVD